MNVTSGQRITLSTGRGGEGRDKFTDAINVVYLSSYGHEMALWWISRCALDCYVSHITLLHSRGALWNSLTRELLYSVTKVPG